MRFSHLISMIVVAAAFCGMGWALAQESEQPLSLIHISEPTRPY